MATVLPSGTIELDREAIGLSDSGQNLLRYDPKEVHLIFGALPVHEGIVAGTFITAERTVPSFTLRKGTDGEGTRVRTQDFSARVQLILQAGSWVNDALSGISASDDATGVIVAPLFLNDRSGRSLYTSKFAFLESPADVSFGTTSGSRAWAFICDRWLPFTGGLERASN